MKRSSSVSFHERGHPLAERCLFTGGRKVASEPESRENGLYFRSIFHKKYGILKEMHDFNEMSGFPRKEERIKGSRVVPVRNKMSV